MKLYKKITAAVLSVGLVASVSAQAVTRETFLGEVLDNADIDERIYAESFSDVKYTHSFADLIQGAVETGVIEKGDFFRPYESITGDEAVLMVTNALEYLKCSFDEAVFDEFKGTSSISDENKTALLEKMVAVYKTSDIKTGDESLDAQINFVRKNIETCVDETAKNTAKEYFDQGYKKIIQNNSENEVTRGKEEIRLAYGALNYNRDSIMTGEYIFDQNGGLIQGHGGNVFFDEKSGKYYWYGEARQTSDPPEHLKKYADWGWRIGVACYSSTDLYNWEYESLALEMLESYEGMKFPESDIRVGEVIERPKVMYNAKTDKYVMWMHIDNGWYGYSRAGVAVSDSPTGPFEYVTSYRPGDKMSRDMTVFQDNDGTAYVYFSTDENGCLACCKLSDDYLEPVGDAHYCIWWKWREAPTVFRYKDTYYMITSGCSGWAPNAADYATAPSPTGPWTQHGNPCVGDGAGQTFGGQSYWVMTIDQEKGHFIFMADIWRPDRHSESGFIWLPIQIQPDGSIRIEWVDEWTIEDMGSMVVQPEDARITYGEEMALPESVKVINRDGENERKVKWNTPSLNAPGHYEIDGVVEGSNSPVEIDVYSVPENLVYFINCGSDSNDEFDVIAENTYNSTSDKEYGIDEKTGKKWGYEFDNNGGSKGDGNMLSSVRYDYSEGGEDAIGTGIRYKMEVDKDKEYSVFVGVNDPWGENGRYIDLSVNGEVIADGHNTKEGYDVFLVKGVKGDEIEIASVRDEKSLDAHLDPIISWIMVVEGDAPEFVKDEKAPAEKEEIKEDATVEKEAVYRTLKLKGTVLALTYDPQKGLRAESYKGKSNQKWELEYTLSGSYMINGCVPYVDDKGNEVVQCLDVLDWGTNPGRGVIAYKKTYGNNQKWFFEKQSDGSYMIKCEHSDLYLTYNSGRFTQEEKGTGYQNWMLEVK